MFRFFCYFFQTFIILNIGFNLIESIIDKINAVKRFLIHVAISDKVASAQISQNITNFSRVRTVVFRLIGKIENAFRSEFLKEIAYFFARKFRHIFTMRDQIEQNIQQKGSCVCQFYSFTSVKYIIILAIRCFITDLGDHSVPEGWIQHPKFNGKGDVPGPPIQWSEPESPDNAQPGYGYIANDTTKEETFFYHSDHLGSTSYITDDHANITQYDAYLPYGELLVDEHSSSEELPYKFNGKQFDDETGLYYYGARYMNPVTSLWYGVDPLAEKYVATGGYVYTLDNPVRLIDPNGNWSWPWERESLIEYRGNGVFGIRIENFSKTMQSNFKRANNNPANWRPGELGINTEIGKISVDNYAHKSFTIGRKPAGIDPKDGNVRIRRPIAKSTGQEDRRFHSFDPMPVRGAAKAVGAIAILDFANYAVDTYMTLSTFWDSNAFDDQMASFRKAIRAVNSQMNSIPDNYRKDTNKMGAILNYVFQGENTTKDKNIDKIGQNILLKSGRYDRTNKTYKPFIKR